MRIDTSRFPRIVLIALPAVLVLIAQAQISGSAFQGLVVVTALVTAFVPIARGGVFPFLKYALMSGEAIPRHAAIVILFAIAFSSIALTALITNNSIVTGGQTYSLAICIVLVGFFALYFLFNLLAEAYFYAAGSTRHDLILSILLSAIVVAAFLVCVFGVPQFSSMSKHAAQLSALILLAPIAVRFLGKNIQIKTEPLSSSRDSLLVALIIALIVSCLSLLTRSQLISAESSNQGVLLANCLMSFGLLKLLLFREIRKLERHYIVSSFKILKECGAAALSSCLILIAGESLTWFLSGISPNSITFHSHLVALAFVLSIVFCGVVSSKLLRLFRLRVTVVAVLFVACLLATVLVWLWPLLSLPTVALIYVGVSWRLRMHELSET